MIKSCTLHHIGYVVADIKTTAEQFVALGYQADGILYDKGLQVELCYLTKVGSATIELVHQLQEDSLEAKLLRAHDVMPYHLGLESEDFDKDCSELIALGYEALFTPTSVEVLGGRRICYFYKSEIGYIELVEK